MPATIDTTLDPSNGTLSCSGGAACAGGYTCSSEDKCVIPLNGAIGVGINDDGTTWWGQPAPGGATDTSTGKWGTSTSRASAGSLPACSRGRTRTACTSASRCARPPAPPPGRCRADSCSSQRSRPLSRRTELERADRLQESRGRVLRQHLRDDAPEHDQGPVHHAAWRRGHVRALGPILSTPSYFACAVPDSNTPQITKWFCSSQGDQVVIRVPAGRRA